MGSELCGMERLFVEVVDRLNGEEDLFLTRSREGIFSPALTMWSMICQRTLGRRRLSDAIEGILDGDAELVLSRNGNGKRVRTGKFSQSSGGISRARKRLSRETVEAVSRLISETVVEQEKGEGLWRGRRVVLFDGTVITLSHSEENVEHYPPMRNQNGRSHNPLMLCMMCHELFSGAALYPQFGPFRGAKATSEQALLYRMLDDLPPECLIMGDRNMGVCGVARAAQVRGHEVLLRLTVTRAESLAGKEAVGSEQCDQEVRWTEKKKRAAGTPSEPEPVGGRFIKWTVKRKGYRPLPLMFFTTSSAPAGELVALYQERERIENDIRSLKYTLGLEMLYGKSRAMVEKELMLGVAAYNLLRGVIRSAAETLKLAPRQISFSRAAGIIRIYGNKMRDAASPKEQADVQERLLVALQQVKLPKRERGRIEPRLVARCRNQFPRLRTTRAEARKQAEKTLEKFGHRGFFTTVSRKY